MKAANDTAPRTWLVTGCSSGIGRALAQELLAMGDQVVATSPNVDTLAGLAASHPDGALVLALDVNDEARAAEVVALAEARFGAVDVLVNNAGYAMIGGVEETLPVEYRRLFDTNFFGAVTMMRAVLPGMRRRKAGRIVNIGSTSAADPGPGMGYYAATKAALAAVTEALSKESAPLGVRVMVVELGGHRTEAIRRATQVALPLPDYVATVGRTRRMMAELGGNEPGDPRLAARAIIAAANVPEPPLHLPLGEDAVARNHAKAERMVAEARVWAPLSPSTSVA